MKSQKKFAGYGAVATDFAGDGPRAPGARASSTAGDPGVVEYGSSSSNNSPCGRDRLLTEDFASHRRPTRYCSPPPATTTTAVAAGAGVGLSPWWRVVVVAAAVATAFSATVGVFSQFSSYAGTEQSLGGEGNIFPSKLSKKASAVPQKTVLVAAGEEERGGGKGTLNVAAATATMASSAAVAAVVLVDDVNGDSNADYEGPAKPVAASSAATTTTNLKEQPRLSSVVPAEAASAGDEEGDAAVVAAAAAIAAAAAVAATEGLTFTATNAYNRRGDSIGVGYCWLKGEILVEPFRTTSLKVESPIEGATYSWTVVDSTSLRSITQGDLEGSTVDVLFGSAPLYTVVLLEKRVDGTLSRSLALEVFCKYVRREIRSLFDDERDEMFDAMKVLWDVGIEEGREKYGEAYVDVWTIDKFHQIGASDLECDHLHDGIGFGIGHSMVTMMFESSLQAVNPKLSLPYWDFTIESYLIDTVYDGDYTKLREATDLWSPEWFGGVDPADFQVKDGRWGNVSVPVVGPDEANLLGADVYGRMRSPWNVNDRTYLSRGLGEMCGIPSTDFYTWPTCESHYELNALLSSYYGYTWHSQYGPHGPVHVWIGGNLDCKKDMQIVESIIGPEYMELIIGYSFIYRKGLFRDGLFKCRGRADPGTTAMEVMQNGMCGCLDLDMDKVEDYTAIYDIFSTGWEFGELTESEKRQLAIQYCNGVIGIGESSQSSSPLDPTFWSLHPTMERLLMFKRITGTMTDLSWPDEPGLFTGDDGTVYDVVISIESDTCNGHRGSDVFPYGILDDLMTPHFTLFDETGPNTRSNRELVHLFDPSVNALNYIYDNFEWPHCAEQGYDMNDLFADIDGEDAAARNDEDGGKAEGQSGMNSKRKEFDFGIFPQGERREQLYGKRSLRSLRERFNQKRT